jgi:hypothetical protein
MKLIGLLLLLTGVALHAEDWTTLDGKTTYKGVSVLSHDDGYVTILDSDGGAKVPLSRLPANLQKRFGYDPAKAAAAVAAAEAQEAMDRQAIAQESDAEARPMTAPPPAPPRVPMDGSPVAASPVSAAPAQPVNSTPAQPGALTAEQRQQIQAQIQSLQDDVAMMQKEIKMTNDRSSSGGSYVSGVREAFTAEPTSLATARTTTRSPPTRSRLRSCRPTSKMATLRRNSDRSLRPARWAVLLPMSRGFSPGTRRP